MRTNRCYAAEGSPGTGRATQLDVEGAAAALFTTNADRTGIPAPSLP
jgi:hypothetical protein